MSFNNWQIGYCTNVHPGTELSSLTSNLKTYAANVRSRLLADGQLGETDMLGVGLWIPKNAAAELTERTAGGEKPKRLPDCLAFAESLGEMGLKPYTVNGFPFGNFHQSVVKHEVYRPSWYEEARQRYTEQLIIILHNLLPENEVGSISTLPLGWGSLSEGTASVAAARLRNIAEFLKDLEDGTGRRIVIAIEPEPGCSLDTSTDVVQFFEKYLASDDQRRYITVCHDICHAAVMNESQASVLASYRDNEISIGKVQVSSAIEVPWFEMDSETAQLALEQLRQFAEDRYLHQTGVVTEDGDFSLIDDLPRLLSKTSAKPPDRLWRIHFHVPIFLDDFGHLRATKRDVLDCLMELGSTPPESLISHLEVETYAWSVLPDSMRSTDLTESIAAELSWLRETVEQL